MRILRRGFSRGIDFEDEQGARDWGMELLRRFVSVSVVLERTGVLSSVYMVIK